MPSSLSLPAAAPFEPGAASHLIAEELGMRAAPVGARCAAFLIDALIYLVLLVPAAVGLWLGFTREFSLWPIVLLAAGTVLTMVFILLQLVSHGRRGTTIGKSAMRLRSVSLPGLERPGFWRIVLRALILWLSNIVPVAGPTLVFVSSYWDSSGRRRSLLDLAARCWLIDVKNGLDPTDENALRKARRDYESQFRDISEHLPVLSSHGVGERPVLDPTRSAAGVIGVAREQWGTEEAVVTHGSVPAQVTDASAAARRASGQRTRYLLIFDDASVARVEHLALLGRAPQPHEAYPTAQAIVVEDSHRMLSKTHLVLGIDRHGPWVQDLGSSNGTTVQRPDETDARPVAPGARVHISAGSTVHIGGRAFRLEEESSVA